ncbi:unnamed protein product [Ambrosiozyma monospora]|uniref:Unnamed protein product n=1 Tax=Ambrosiozyma monospora TaxID=43982 RepID=A0ACB5UD18_AMBMO|nr:unnamed protein product [Ambrosiozyma monospora]
MATLEDLDNNQQLEIDQEILNSSTADIINRTKLLDNEIKVFRSELLRLQHEKSVMLEKIKDNKQKIKNNKQLPYLVGNVVEMLDVQVDEDAVEEGANVDLDSTRVGKSAVVKTSTRQTVFLPLIGLVEPEELKPE